MNNNKYPLAIYVVTHRKFKEKELYQNKIYSTFNRDINKYFDRGINIPVFFTDSKNIKIDKKLYKNIVVVILIDDEMLIERNFFDNKILKDKDLDIYSFALCSNAFKLGAYFTKHNLIRVYTEKNKLDFLVTELAHDLIKVLLNTERLKVFISHAKADGKDIAIHAQCFFNTQSRLSSFFDANYIQDSTKWKEELENGVKTSILLVFHTDIYSSREWCKKEILFAKEVEAPILVVNSLKAKEHRSFPYMSNVPVLKMKNSLNNFQNIVKALLLESLRAYYQKQEIKSLMKTFYSKEKLTILSYPPELLTLVNQKDKSNFIYPEPPLGDEEIKILKSFKKSSFNTPLTYINNKNNTYKNLKIGISISESQDIERFGLSQIHLRDFIIELTRYLLSNKIKLLYGGVIRYDNDFNFAEIISQLVDDYNEKYNGQEVIKNYSIFPIDTKTKSRLLDIVDFEEITLDIEETESNKQYLFSEKLIKMRTIMNKDLDIRIIAGGKDEEFMGKYPGILEEAYLAIKSEKPMFLIGAFGGATKKVINILQKNKKVKEFSKEYQLKNESFKKLVEFYKNIKKENEIDYEEIIGLFQEKSVSDLNNGLTLKENKVLFKSQNIYEIIYLILKGIKNIKDKK